MISDSFNKNIKISNVIDNLINLFNNAAPEINPDNPKLAKWQHQIWDLWDINPLNIGNRSKFMEILIEKFLKSRVRNCSTF